jgi:hydroxyacylglutathione hydrolase
MIFRQIVRSESGCASYLIGCAATGQAAVIDPLADLGAQSYLLEAADRGLRISYVIDTHIHADHRSAAQELARISNATLALPADADVDYHFLSLYDGDRIQLGKVYLTVMHTPGHTPESICLLGTDTARSEQPWFLLSGDTLFPGDVGRPDLQIDEDASRRTQIQVGQLYDSLFGRLLKLDDIVEIYPGHFGGSACGGVNMSGKPISTIGFERRWNLALQHHDREAFCKFVMETLRPQPEQYQRIKRENMQPWQPTRRRTTESASPAALSPASLQALREEGVILLDLRPAPDFAAAHAPGAISIPFSRADLTTNVATLLPRGAAVVLVADNEIIANEAAALLRSDGWAVRGHLAGGMAAWWGAGLGVEQLELWPLERFHEHRDSFTIIDVREPHEWEHGVIDGALLIPQGQLWARQHEIPRDHPIMTICAGGVRSARAASLLQYLGFPKVATVDRAGMHDWQKRGYAVSVPV